MRRRIPEPKGLMAASDDDALRQVADVALRAADAEARRLGVTVRAVVGLDDPDREVSAFGHCGFDHPLQAGQALSQHARTVERGMSRAVHAHASRN